MDQHLCQNIFIPASNILTEVPHQTKLQHGGNLHHPMQSKNVRGVLIHCLLTLAPGFLAGSLSLPITLWGPTKKAFCVNSICWCKEENKNIGLIEPSTWNKRAMTILNQACLYYQKHIYIAILFISAHGSFLLETSGWALCTHREACKLKQCPS